MTTENKDYMTSDEDEYLEEEKQHNEHPPRGHRPPPMGHRPPPPHHAHHRCENGEHQGPPPRRGMSVITLILIAIIIGLLLYIHVS